MKKPIIISTIFLIISTSCFSIDLKFFDESIKILEEKSYYQKTSFELKLSLIETFRDKLGFEINFIGKTKNNAVIQYNGQQINIDNLNFNQSLFLFEKEIRGIINRYDLKIDIDIYVVDILISGLDPSGRLSENKLPRNGLNSAIKISSSSINLFQIKKIFKNKLILSDSIDLTDTLVSIDNIPTKFLTTDLIEEITSNLYSTELGFKNSKSIRVTLKDTIIKQAEISNRTPILQLKLESNFLIISELYFLNYDLTDLFKTVNKNKKNLKGIIIDLRNCNGGELTNIFKFTEPFVDANSLLYTMKTKKKDFKITSFKKGNLYGIPLKLIVNNKTVSGAELFCYVLKLKSNAQIIGSKTNGFGFVHYLKSFETKNYMLKYRGGELILADGQSLNNNGLVPDIEYDKEDIIERAKQ